MKNQRVAVLGGSQGLGLAVARRVIREGGEAIIVSSRQANVDAAVRELGAGATGHVADLRSDEAIGALFAKIGRFDHLVYTAGEHLLLSPLAELDVAAAQRFFELRYWGALRAVKRARAQLDLKGSIVFTGGLAARRPPPGFAIGASICGAMESLTRALALELAPVRVNIVVPGFFDTGLWSDVPAANREAMFKAAAASLPVKRIGTPDDIAGHYLAFMQGGFTTGQVAVVDGGGALV